MADVKEKVKLTISGLKKDLEDGYTRPQMAKKYGISVGMMKKALDKAGLSDVKTKRVSFILEDDTVQEENNVQEVVAEAVEQENKTEEFTGIMIENSSID